VTRRAFVSGYDADDVACGGCQADIEDFYNGIECYLRPVKPT
jgi:hypothetical protein